MGVKILGIAGSPRHGNTELAVKEALEGAAELEGVETEFLTIAGADIRGGCTGCYRCTEAKKPHRKVLCLNPDINKDDVNEIFRRMIEADGWLVGVPVYFGSIPAQFKAIIDRSMAVEYANCAFRNKVAGALVTAFDRNGGLEHTISHLQNWFLIHDMLPVSVGPERPREQGGIGSYFGGTVLQGWPHPCMDEEREFDAVKDDYIGMRQVRFLGKRTAEMTLVVKAGFEHTKTVWPYRGL